MLCTRSSTAAKWATFFLKQFYNSVDPFSYILFRRCAVCHPRGAVRLHRALLQVNGRKDRGVRHARFLDVLQGQNRPAVLIEAGFMSNPDEARRAADPAYRQKLAEAVAKALE